MLDIENHVDIVWSFKVIWFHKYFWKNYPRLQ